MKLVTQMVAFEESYDTQCSVTFEELQATSDKFRVEFSEFRSQQAIRRENQKPAQG